jgi:hypothetical protein
VQLTLTLTLTVTLTLTLTPLYLLAILPVEVERNSGWQGRSVQGIAGKKKGEFEVEARLANYIQTLVKFCLNYY